jgi:hypothetical protein
MPAIARIANRLTAARMGKRIVEVFTKGGGVRHIGPVKDRGENKDNGEQ